jgi:hypothetical protein
MLYLKATEQGPRELEPLRSWGTFTRYVEIGDDRYAVRQVDVYANGYALRYDRTHWVDDLGVLTDSFYRPKKNWERWWGPSLEMAVEEFEQVWTGAEMSSVRQVQISTARMGVGGCPTEPIWLANSLDEWSEEYQRLENALLPYHSRVIAKVPFPINLQGLNEPERVFFNLWFYWHAALLNAGEVFSWLFLVIENEEAFVAAGAEGTLKAMAKLMSFYREQQKLKDQSEKDAYGRRTKDERASAELFAEDTNEFAKLLLAYAEKNLAAP